MFKRLLERGWLVVIVPVITLFFSAILFGLYGTYLAIETGYKFFVYPEYREVTELAPKFFSVIDVFLLSMVLYIFALGLYELFVGKLNVPPGEADPWLLSAGRVWYDWHGGVARVSDFGGEGRKVGEAHRWIGKQGKPDLDKRSSFVLRAW